jgi:regulator of protease activity HflC (stomatin/prohibitin superfamily)
MLSNAYFTWGFLSGLLALAAVLASRCFFRVAEGHLAVLESFGRAIADGPDRRALRTYGPGLNTKAPWHRVHSVPIMEQNLDLSGDHRGLSAMTEDGTILRFDSILRFSPLPERLYDYLFELRAPIEHITGLFACLLRNEIANFHPNDSSAEHEIGSYAMLRRERQHLHANIEGFVRQRIGEHYGVRFHAVDLTDILPPDELADALNAVINAHAEANTLYARAEADNQQKLLAAERGVAIAHEHAQAAADEARVLAAHLARLHGAGVLSSYIARRRAEVYGEARSLFLHEPEVLSAISAPASRGKEAA